MWETGDDGVWDPTLAAKHPEPQLVNHGSYLRLQPLTVLVPRDNLVAVPFVRVREGMVIVLIKSPA